MQVIANPLSFYPRERATLLNKKVIAVGNHGFAKGFDRLLLSWKEVVIKYSKWQLEIYGKKDPNQKLEKLIDEYNLFNNVKLFNPETNIQEKYLEASIYVLSSRSEGFGMVLIEAMACGVPCIAFDCPHGPADIITHNEDGILVKNGDIAAFANALISLMDDEDKRKKMGQKAKENVKRYLPTFIIQQWDQLFNSLISKDD